MKKYLWLLIGVLLIFLDQVSKYLLTNVHASLGIFALNYTTNKGISFGLFQGSTLLISVLSVIVLAFLFYHRKEFYGREIFLVLISSGIIGNLIDRVALGYVRDFIDFGWWPVFNVADSMMFIGVFGLIISHLLTEKKINKKASQRKQ